jgi:hypothetical protein
MFNEKSKKAPANQADRVKTGKKKQNFNMLSKKRQKRSFAKSYLGE